MLMPEADLEMTRQTGQQSTVNRFQLLSRVGQVFLVDATSWIVENRLNYIRTHQARLLSQDVAEVAGADHDADPPRGDEAGGGEADEGEIDHHQANEIVRSSRRRREWQYGEITVVGVIGKKKKRRKRRYR